jgi:eukaryotic-like serine/threonine-protein kinase
LEWLKPADPTELGGIALRGRLGQGGMGTVYFGVTPDGDQVAVKTVREDLLGKSVVRGRFDREILALGMVQGPRVAGLIQASDPEDVPPWFAIDYVRGLTLAEYVQGKGPLPGAMGAALGVMLAEGLAEIHNAGVLHRDLKPANILLGKDGPKVIDFGLATLADAAEDITCTGEVLGTPRCMAPEQARSPKEVTSAIDVYALGAVLVFATTGHYLYDRPNMPALLFAIADPGTAPDLSGLPAPLTEPVTAMLSHDPLSRPPLDEITKTLTAVLADNGISTTDAQRRLADLTYVERESDPSPADPPRRARLRMAKDPHVLSDLVRQIADSLRQGYACEALF